MQRLPHFPLLTGGRLEFRRTNGLQVPLLVAFLLALPCLVFRYLPMVDLPQHEAVTSIMLHLRDHRWAFDTYYEWAPCRTLYLLPYGLASALSLVMPLHSALKCIVFASVLAYPVGALLYQRALDRPAWLGLLALPIVYNQSFFWGFISFNLAIGMVFVALGAMLGPWKKSKAYFVALCGLAIGLTHIYGLLLFFAYVGLWVISKDRAEALRRVPALLPAALTLALWLFLVANASGSTGMVWANVGARWSKLTDSILGGWRGRSELVGLLSAGVVVALFFRRSIPVTFSRYHALGVHQKIVWQLVALNLLLYFTMPELRLAAMKASFRHAQLAAMAFPLALSADSAGLEHYLSRLGTYLLAAYVLGTSWWHFRLFDAEARSFDAIVDAVPRSARVAQLTYERRGRWSKVPAYVHFAAYIQAWKGGLVAVSFPARFWNVPIKAKTSSAFPPVPNDLEWKPYLFSESQLSPHFDYLVLRTPRSGEPSLPLAFPYRLEMKSGPWRLFRKCEPVQ